MDEVLAILRYVLLLWGTIYFITQSAIFRPLRVMLGSNSMWAATFIYCPACVGAWAGVGMWELLPWSATPGWWGAMPLVESMYASMALGRVWGVWFGDNTFEVEMPMLDCFNIEGKTDGDSGGNRVSGD